LNSLFILLAITISQFPENYQGIHETEWLRHRGSTVTVSSPPGAIELRTRQRPLSKVVYGYYPYWMGTSYNNLQYDLLSHIAYFSVELKGDGTLGTIPNISTMENLRNIAHSNGVQVLITATQFDNVIILNLLNSATARTNAINNLFNLVTNYTLDGVSIDFEMPTNPVKDSLTLFIQDLTDYFHTNLPGSHISIATPAVDWGNAFDYDLLALHSDGLFIMAYNYYWSGSSYAGPVSPLPSSTLWGTYSVMWTVNDYIQYGIYADKFILGCPYYGLRWLTENDSIKSPTRGTGGALTYTRATDSAVVYGKLWDDTSKTVWYANYITGDGWYQGWFDDSLSLRMKYQVVLDSSLCGAGIWALGYDGTKPELWGALRDAFYYTGIKKADNRQETRDIRLSAHPNPFTKTVEIRYSIPEISKIENRNLALSQFPISLCIYDVSGRIVKNFPISNFKFPVSEVTWDSRDDSGTLLPSGIYLCALTSGGYRETLKIHFLR